MTNTVVTVPPCSASTGISIFIDSMITTGLARANLVAGWQPAMTGHWPPSLPGSAQPRRHPTMTVGSRSPGALAELDVDKHRALDDAAHDVDNERVVLLS